MTVLAGFCIGLPVIAMVVVMLIIAAVARSGPRSVKRRLYDELYQRLKLQADHDALYCPYCGKASAHDVIKCTYCGADKQSRKAIKLDAGLFDDHPEVIKKRDDTSTRGHMLIVAIMLVGLLWALLCVVIPVLNAIVKGL